jgi:dephospho-CoA kinase
LRELERLLDPGVRQAIADRIANTRADVLVLDAIRLIEAGTAARCDAVWVVVCDQAAQMERLSTSRGMTAEQAALRIAAQAPAEDKLRFATDVITNHSTLDDLAQQVETAWQRTVQPKLQG